MMREAWWAAAMGCALVMAGTGCDDTEGDPPAERGGMHGTGGAQSTGGVSSAGGRAGSSGGGGSGATTDAREVDDFHRSFWQALCRKLFRCSSANDDDIGFKAALGTEARCVDMVAELERRRPRFIDLKQKLASGEVRFVPASAAACLEEASRCGYGNRSDLESHGPACRAVFEGSVALGEPCQRGEECAGDARCAIDEVCPGKCRARAALGETCDTFRDCDDTAGVTECRYSAASQGSSCVRVTIAAAADMGQPCTAVLGEGISFVPCAAGLWCDGDASASPSTGTCRAPLLDGALCDNNDDLCVDGDSCFDLKTCKPLEFGTRAGDACDDAVGPYCDPFARLSCVSGKCQVLGDGSPGSACSTGDIHGELDCNGATRCDGGSAGTSPTCQPLLATGAACRSRAQCTSGACANDVCAAAYCGL